MVLAKESLAERAPRKPAWVHGTAMRSEPTMFAGRDSVSPEAGKRAAADLYKACGVTNPRPFKNAIARDARPRLIEARGEAPNSMSGARSPSPKSAGSRVARTSLPMSSMPSGRPTGFWD